MRQLRFTGTDSKVNNCPALHTDTETGEVIVQGTPLTDPKELDQLKHFDSSSEAAVIVPAELLVNWGPKEITHVPDMVSQDDYSRLFETFKHTAWRLESRTGYASDREDPDFHSFLKTGTTVPDDAEPWFHNIRRQTGDGMSVGRVRIIDRPPTQNQLFLLDYARHNAAAGEDMRYLWRADATALPAEDFWLFDSRIVALLHFDDGDDLTGIELITEPAAVVRYCMARDTAMHHAIPYEYIAAELRGRH